MAYSAISAMLKRKVWLRYSGRRLYPNFYALLVGPPGVGKTHAIKIVKEIMSKVPGTAHTPQMVSKEKFLQNMVSYAMAAATPPGRDVNPMLLLDYTCAYPVFLEEFGTFIHRDEHFMRILTDLYDCHDDWTNETKHAGIDKLKKIYLNLIGGITPASLADDFGDIALNMGFLARFILVYSETREYSDPFAQTEELDDRRLVHDLEVISRLTGEFTVSNPAKEFVRGWLRAGLAPLPDESRLASYCARREIHFMKMAMILSVAERSDLHIELSHVEAAKAYLLGVERDMPKALLFFGGSTISATMRSVHRWAKVVSDMGKKPIPESLIRMQLIRDVPPQYMEQTVDSLLSTGYFTATGLKPARAFLPIMQREEGPATTGAGGQ